MSFKTFYGSMQGFSNYPVYRAGGRESGMTLHASSRNGGVRLRMEIRDGIEWCTITAFVPLNYFYPQNIDDSHERVTVYDGPVYNLARNLR